MEIYDISLPISESMVIWPGDSPVRITHRSHLDRGDELTVSRLDLGAHCGTHVDAPSHFIAGGVGVDALDLGVLIGPTLVVHAQDVDALTAEVLERLAIPPDTERLLLRTRNSERWARGETTFDPNFVGITEDGARWLVARGIRLVGVDYMSVGPYTGWAPTHHVLLGAAIVTVEGLDLSEIDPGVYQLVCLPLRITDGDGAPARAILIEQ
jgi:arylformamidase